VKQPPRICENDSVINVAEQFPHSTEAEAAEPTEALSSVVHRLRSELDGLRRAMRNRAIIEQAKGVLAARLGIGPEDAFDHLLELSQRTNTKLAEVAAALVGTTAPDPAVPGTTGIYSDELRTTVSTRLRRTTEGSGRRPARSPEREALQSQQQMLASRIAAAKSYGEIVDVIAETAVAWPGLSSVVLCLCEMDGALRVVASHGLTAEVRSQWTRIPPQVGVPLNAAVAERKALLLDVGALNEHFPVVRDISPDTVTMACLPLISDDHVIGVLGLSWSEPLRITGLNRRYLLALAEVVTRAVKSGPGTAESEPAVPPLRVIDRLEHGLLPIVLDPLHDPAALLAPITEGDQIIDFEFEYANQAARQLTKGEQIDLDSATLLEAFPEVGSRLLLGEYAKVLRTGHPYVVDDLHIAAQREGTKASYTFAARATRLADRVLVVWRIRTDADLLHDQLLSAERIARAGSFWWNLRSGDLRWSPGMFRLFDRDPAEGPADLDQWDRYVDREDWLGVQNAVDRLLAGRPAELEFRLTGHLAGRRLRLRAEPFTEPFGVYAISGTVRDVSGERAAEARLRRAEEALAVQRMRLDAERHAISSLREAVLPGAPDLAGTPGLTIRGLCRSPAGSGRVAGDWFDVLTVRGRTFLVIGDVAGSGMAATTAAIQLRSAIRAYAVHGLTPGELLAGLNRMLCELDPDRLATLTIAEFAAEDRTLCWAAAGHAKPVRYADTGDGFVMDGPVGVPIGALPDASYTDTSVELEPNDRLLLYTDGLLSRRDTPATDGLDVLLRAGFEVDLDDIEALVDHVNEKLGSEPHDDLCLVTALVL
jgi:hypothetical protein